MWASNPAETRISSGAKASSAGSTRASIAARHSAPPAPAGKRRVDDIAVDARFMGVPSAGIERRLVGGGKHQPRLALGDGLGAVAVMDVEIDDGDARQPVRLQRVQRGDGDIVENAKAHRRGGFGVVARRAHGAERHVVLARQHRIHRGDARAGGAIGGFARTGREEGVGIELHARLARLRERCFKRLDH